MATTHHDNPSPVGAGTTPTESAFVPVARGRAVARASVWLAPALVHALISWHILTDIRLEAASGANTVVAVAWIAMLVPFGLVGAVMVIVGLRWLALALWPGRVGVTATADELKLALGPFGTRSFDASRLEAKYFFELSIDVVDEGFEALLPDEEQVANFLPRLRHPDAKEPLNRRLMRFATGTEPEIAQTLRPVIACWRRETEVPE